jgi:hypothetical protein
MSALTMLWIRIRSDGELFGLFGSDNFFFKKSKANLDSEEGLETLCPDPEYRI